MVDDPADKPDPKDDPKDEPVDKPDPKDDLGDPGKKALDAERKARSAAEKRAKDAEARVREFEDKDKSEAQKAADAKAASDKRADDADARALRLEVAFEKGLTPKQAKRLTGSTREELEADAEELLEDFKPSDETKRPPTTRPRERLRGGADPEDEPEEIDQDKILAAIPRRY